MGRLSSTENMREVEILKNSIPDEGAIAFSGGLDSSLIAFLGLKKGNFVGYVAGLEGSHDILWAEKAAKMLGLPLKKIIVDEEDVRDAYYELKDLIGMDNRIIISFEMPLYFVARECTESKIITGQGADELFGGYKRYESMDADTLEMEMNKDLDELLNTGVKRERGIAEHFGKELITPYLNPDFVQVVRERSASERKGIGRKEMLREIAREAGLPEEICSKSKKAAQYGSGIMKVLKKMQ